MGVFWPLGGKLHITLQAEEKVVVSVVCLLRKMDISMSVFMPEIVAGGCRTTIKLPSHVLLKSRISREKI